MIKLILLLLVLSPINTVEKIAATPRPTGSISCQNSRDFIINDLKESGYRPTVQSFTYNRLRVENVVAVRSGKDKVIVVGAHYDSVSRSPGADDNASGVAGVLEIAKRVSRGKGSKIVFILFSGEEQGLIGSRHWVKNNKEKIDFMINLDMIGHYRGKMIGTGSSDHSSLNCERVFIHTGTHRHYHQPSDLPGTLDYNGIDKVIDYCLKLIDDSENDYNLFGEQQ